MGEERMMEGLTISQLAEKNALLVTENATLQKKLDAVLAENANMRSAIDQTIGWQESVDAENVESVRLLVDLNTPATDAILNEVRAEGVEMFAAEREELRKHYVAKKDREMAVSADHCAMAAFAFAEELRAREVGGANHD